MSKQRDQEWREHARRLARQALVSAENTLGSRGTVLLPLLFNQLEVGLPRAVDYWLRTRGDTLHTDFASQEARFLSLAGSDLRRDYLAIKGGLPRLAGILFDQLGSDDIKSIHLSAPELTDWRQAALDWLDAARQLVHRLLDEQPPRAESGRRIERGALLGRLDVLTPCLLVASAGGSTHRWPESKTHAGLFSFGMPLNGQTGLVLPIALCRDSELRQRLLNLAQWLRQPPAGSSVIDNRRFLQEWLAANGFPYLRLTDKEPVDGWACFELIPAVFQQLLHACEYVTAVRDDQNVLTQILAHAPFRWSSHGELLEWRHSAASDNRPIHPFKLFLSNDLAACRRMFLSLAERQRLFRPVEYWRRSAVPAACTPATITVRLSQKPCGWAALQLTAGERSVEVELSDVYDPFPMLLEWLRAISLQDLPVGFEIDEEGDEKRLLAHAAADGCLLLAVLDRWDNNEHFAAIVDRAAFLRAFRQELRRYEQEEFDPENWLYDLEDEERAAYRQRIFRHLFLTEDEDSPRLD